jgi:hypothetical protein
LLPVVASLRHVTGGVIRLSQTAATAYRLHLFDPS